MGTPDEPAVVSLKYDSGNANEEVIPGIECTLVVLPREITITANDVSVVYGDDGYVNAELTYRLSRNAIVGSDELNVVLSREEGVTPGDYAINLSYNNELYNATLVPGTYRIETAYRFKELFLTGTSDARDTEYFTRICGK